jgi:hypothetical protein
MHGVAQGAPFGDGQRRRLLQVDVLPRFYGVNRNDRVPVIGRADDDGVDVLVRQQLAVVAIADHPVVRLPRLFRVLAVDQHLRVLDPPAVEIARRHDARRLMLPDAGKIVAAGDAPGADRADVDPLARRERAEHGRGDDRRKPGRDR